MSAILRGTFLFCLVQTVARDTRTCQAALPLGANSFGRRQQSVLLVLGCHLDSDFHLFLHLPQLAPWRRRATPVGHLVVAAVGAGRALALLLLVLDEEQDVTQREGVLALTAGQEVVVSQARGQRGHCVGAQEGVGVRAQFDQG